MFRTGKLLLVTIALFQTLPAEARSLKPLVEDAQNVSATITSCAGPRSDATMGASCALYRTRFAEKALSCAPLGRSDRPHCMQSGSGMFRRDAYQCTTTVEYMACLKHASDEALSESAATQ